MIQIETPAVRRMATNAQGEMVAETRSRNQWTREEMLSFRPQEAALDERWKAPPALKEAAFDADDKSESGGMDVDEFPEKSDDYIDRTRKQFTREQLLSFAPPEGTVEDERGAPYEFEEHVVEDGGESERAPCDMDENQERPPDCANRSEEQLSLKQSLRIRPGRQWTREELLSFAPQEQ